MASQQQQTRTQRQQAKENQIIEQRSGKARARLFGKGAAAFLLSRVETRCPRPQKAPPCDTPTLCAWKALHLCKIDLNQNARLRFHSDRIAIRAF
jgi:hypothetical protein